MSYNPHITAARREAKARAKTNGASYQAALEEIAREAGASDWKDYLENPVPVRKQELKDHITTSHEATAPGESRKHHGHQVGKLYDGPIDWDRVVAFNLGQGYLLAISGFMLMAATIALANTRIIASPYVLKHAEISAGLMGLVGMVVAMLMTFAVVIPLSNIVIATMVAKGAKPGLPLRTWVRMWGNVAMRTAFVMLMVGGFVVYGQNLMLPIPPDQAMKAYEEALESKRIAFIKPDTSYMLGTLSRTGQTIGMSIIVIDNRMTPHQFRHRPLPSKLGGETIMRAFGTHPVLRLAGWADCSAGTFNPVRVEVADTVRGPPVQTKVITFKKAWQMTEQSTRSMCASRQMGEKVVSRDAAQNQQTIDDR